MSKGIWEGTVGPVPGQPRGERWLCEPDSRQAFASRRPDQGCGDGVRVGVGVGSLPTAKIRMCLCSTWGSSSGGTP